MTGFWVRAGVRAGKAIVGVKPFKKFKGQKSVKDIQLKTSSKKFQMAVENFKEKTKEAYSKTKKTKTKHYYAPKDFLK